MRPVRRWRMTNRTSPALSFCRMVLALPSGAICQAISVHALIVR